MERAGRCGATRAAVASSKSKRVTPRAVGREVFRPVVVGELALRKGQASLKLTAESVQAQCPALN